MNFLKSRPATHQRLVQKRIYSLLYLVFVLLFLMAPDRSWHCNYFYVFIIPIYLIFLQAARIKVLFRSKSWLLAMVLISYLLLTMMWGKNPGDDGRIYYLRKAVYLFVFFSLSLELVLKDPRFIDKLFVLLAWVGAASAIVSMLYFYASAPFPSTRLAYFADQLRNPIRGAIIHGMIVLIIYFHLLQSRDKPGRWIYGVLALIIIASLLLTQSRGPLAILLATFLVGGFLTRDKKLLVVLGCLIVIGLTLFLSVPKYRLLITERGFGYRIELARKTLTMAKDDLFFGKGITTEQKIMSDDGRNLHHPHNIYLGMVLYGGLAGLFLLLLFLVFGLHDAWRDYLSTNNITLMVLILFGAGTVIASQDKIITHPAPLWLSFWLPLALAAGKTQAADSPTNKNRADQHP